MTARDFTSTGLVLYLNIDYSIRDERGKLYALDIARKLYARGLVVDWNTPFQLLIDTGFDLDAVRMLTASSNE